MVDFPIAILVYRSIKYIEKVRFFNSSVASRRCSKKTLSPCAGPVMSLVHWWKIKGFVSSWTAKGLLLWHQMSPVGGNSEAKNTHLVIHKLSIKYILQCGFEHAIFTNLMICFHLSTDLKSFFERGWNLFFSGFCYHSFRCLTQLSSLRHRHLLYFFPGLVLISNGFPPNFQTTAETPRHPRKH